MDGEKELVKSRFSDKMRDECFMVSLIWWNKWKEYVNYDYEDKKVVEKKPAHPGRISNFDLMYSYHIIRL